MPSVNWRIFGIAILLCAGAAWAVHHWLHLPLWVSFGIVVLAVLVNGWIAEIEDTPR